MEVVQTRLQTLEGPLIPLEPALQVRLVRLAVLRGMPGHPLDFRAGELHAELLGDLFRYLFLGRQHIPGLEAVLVSPDLAIPVHIDQLRADDEAIAPPHQSAGQHRAYFELLPGFVSTP